MIPAIIPDMDTVLALVREAKELGHRGILIPTRWFDRPAYHDPWYEPLWTLTEELGLVLHTHSGAGPSDIGLGPGMLPIYASEAGWWAARPLAVLIWGGIFERHPDLKYSMAENAAWWVPDQIRKMDEKWVGGHNTRKFGNAFRQELSMKPSDYLNRNCFFGASTPGEDDIERRYLIGIGNIMWGNDLPHPEGTFPYTRYWIRERFKHVPEAETRRILGLTAAAVYGVDVDALRPLVERIGPTSTKCTATRRCHASPPASEHRSNHVDQRAPLRDVQRVPDAEGPAGAGGPRPAPDRAQPRRANDASRSPSRTAGSSWREARDLTPGEVRTFHVFGRDVVLFRGDDGAPHMVDAYCAHLGAHIGVGGRVEGDCIRCPFHGWRYDGDTGQCQEIPYGNMDRVPSQARIRSYPCIERNQMIWAWHHGERGEPFYDVPEVPELFDPEWLPYEIVEFDVATCCQEMAENNVDFAHFMYVHGTDAIPDDEFVIDGSYKRTVGADGNFVREGFGLGLGVLRIKGYTTFISSTTPIDEENVKVRWIFTSPVANGPDAAQQAAVNFSAGVSQDLPIWENKRYVERPVLTKSEKKLLEQREWAKQFYSNYEDGK